MTNFVNCIFIFLQNWVSRVTSLREKKNKQEKKMNQLKKEIKKMHNVIVLLLQVSNKTKRIKKLLRAQCVVCRD